MKHREKYHIVNWLLMIASDLKILKYGVYELNFEGMQRNPTSHLILSGSYFNRNLIRQFIIQMLVI